MKRRFRLSELRRRIVRVLKRRRHLEWLEVDTVTTADDETWATELVQRRGWDELREKK